MVLLQKMKEALLMTISPFLFWENKTLLKKATCMDSLSQIFEYGILKYKYEVRMLNKIM